MRIAQPSAHREICRSRLPSPDLAARSHSRHLRAIADFGAAVRLAPENARPLYVRGLARRVRGDAVGAEADIAKLFGDEGK